jgi:hypothetical protein
MMPNRRVAHPPGIGNVSVAYCVINYSASIQAKTFAVQQLRSLILALGQERRQWLQGRNDLKVFMVAQIGFEPATFGLLVT